VTRVAKKLRAEAALVCSAAASRAVLIPESVRRAEHVTIWRFSPPLDLAPLVRELEVTPEAGDLADEAQAVALDRMSRVESLPEWCALFVERYRLAWAEAEAMLQQGWAP
jgi:hypothetical protein